MKNRDVLALALQVVATNNHANKDGTLSHEGLIAREAARNLLKIMSSKDSVCHHENTVATIRFPLVSADGGRCPACFKKVIRPDGEDWR